MTVLSISDLCKTGLRVHVKSSLILLIDMKACWLLSILSSLFALRKFFFSYFKPNYKLLSTALMLSGDFSEDFLEEEERFSPDSYSAITGSFISCFFYSWKSLNEETLDYFLFRERASI